MDNQVHNQIVSFIWSIADDCLRDVYVRGKYRDVILPMTVIRRLDALLEDSKEAVLDMKKKLDAAGIDNQWPALCNVAGQAFCNASPFRLRDLTSRAKKQTLKTDFEAYLDGFSPNVQEILEKFKFRNQIDTMIEADILGAVIEKFISSDINLSPNPVYKDEKKTILKHPGLDNHGMGTIFEELIRKFNEENNEEAGEHWTPRDVVELMADLIFMPIADQIKDATYSCYDGACGTGGMLTVAQDRLMTLAARRGKNVSIHLFGQEINPETYAICKADMLLKGDGDQAEHISYGSTLSLDGNATRQFDFMLPNRNRKLFLDVSNDFSSFPLVFRYSRTLFEPPFPPVPRVSVVIHVVKNASRQKDGKRFLCSRCLHCNSGQRVMQVVSARTAVQRLRCYRQRIQSSSLYALNMVICHNQIIRNFLICHGTVHIRPWSASAVCEINKRSRRVLSVFCNRPINRREFFCAFFSKQNAASCG